MHEISENIFNAISNCATVNSLELYRNLINQQSTDIDLRLSFIGAIGARYFDISHYEMLTGIYYPECSLN